MLAKKNRADTKAVERIFRESGTITSPIFTFKFVPGSGTGISRISVIVPKTISKKAVDRNNLRRRGYAALKKHINKFPSLVGVLIFKKYEDNITIIENEIENILNKSR